MLGKIMKPILKSVIIVVLSYHGIVGAAWLISNLTVGIFSEWGRGGAIFFLFCIAVVAPVVSSALVVGIVGGLWVGVNRSIGFIIASLVACIEFVNVVFIGRHEITFFGISGLIILAGLPGIIFAGGLTYARVFKWQKAKTVSMT